MIKYYPLLISDKSDIRLYKITRLDAVMYGLKLIPKTLWSYNDLLHLCQRSYIYG